MNNKDALLRNFLLEDYKLKVQYLTNHFSRMWTRFNFFLTINSALFAFSVQKDTATFVLLFVVAGLLLSALWYCFGAVDNYLVEVYRKQVGTTYYLLGLKEPGLNELQSREDLREVYSHVGDIKTKFLDQKDGEVHVNPDPIERNPFQWRYTLHWKYKEQEHEQSISATELAVILPFAFLLLWLVRFAIQFP
jgi:hypothetical protein